MKNLLKRFLLGGLLFPFLISCIQDEAPNSECDIEQIIINHKDVIGSPNIGSNVITIYANPSIDLTAIAPEFILTQGATIYPKSGTTIDFTNGMTYKVTSEDGLWSKNYEIRFIVDFPTHFNFDHFEIFNNTFCKFYEQIKDERQDWASGNSGFQLTGQGKSPDLYPTYYSEDVKEGSYALKLETKSTGSWGAAMGMPIAAGNLFLGTFRTTSALTNPLKATRFGVPFPLKPSRLTGWYKYKRGSVFTNKNNEIISDREDICDIYAVLFDITELKENEDYLTGENVLTSPSIVALARLDNASENNEYIEFDIPFDYFQDYDIEKQKDFKYRISVVFSSSRNGDVFEGAVGSILQVDNVELICEE